MLEPMTTRLDDYAFTVHLDLPYEDALERVTGALKEEGFGVLVSIDVQQTLKEKIDVDFRKYAILGACNPTLANRALSSEPQVGLLLPCNVIVYEDEAGSGTTVSVVDPLGMLGDIDVPELQSVAAEAHGRLAKVAEALES
jgi:uncharacterized protein (DUF302 family)